MPAVQTKAPCRSRAGPSSALSSRGPSLSIGKAARSTGRTPRGALRPRRPNRASIGRGRPSQSRDTSCQTNNSKSPGARRSASPAFPVAAPVHRRRQSRRDETLQMPAEGDDADGPVRLFGLHAVEAALKNPARRVNRLLLTENAERRLVEAVGPDYGNDRACVAARSRPASRLRRGASRRDARDRAASRTRLARPGRSRGRTSADRARPSHRSAQCRRGAAILGRLRRQRPRHDTPAQSAAQWRACEVSFGRPRTRAGGAGRQSVARTR